MKPASVSEIKKELQLQDKEKLIEICLRLARFKTENKELLTYLLFEAEDERLYIQLIKESIDLQFNEINTNHYYYVKKSGRKILRQVNKFIRYSGQKRTAVELLMHFCMKLKDVNIPNHKSVAIEKMYVNQIEKIRKNISGLHEDLQYDYKKELDKLGSRL
jgi:GMP synthase PP-ATPase subunit